jgi:hypothetical protein
MPDIKEFKIAVPQEKLDRLKKKLELTDWPTELEDAPKWQYGSPMCVPIHITWLLLLVIDCTDINPGLTSNVLLTIGSINSTGAPRKRR